MMKKQRSEIPKDADEWYLSRAMAQTPRRPMESVRSRGALFSILFSLAFSATLFFSASVSAQESDRDAEARLHFEAGAAAFEAGHFFDALKSFERSYELSNRPQLLFNIGSAADRARLDDRALAAYQRYLEALPDASNREYVEERISLIRTARSARQEASREAEAAREAAARARAQAQAAEQAKAEAREGESNAEALARAEEAQREAALLAEQAEARALAAEQAEARARALEERAREQAEVAERAALQAQEAERRAAEAERRAAERADGDVKRRRPGLWVVAGVLVVGAAVGTGVYLSQRTEILPPVEGTIGGIIRTLEYEP